MIREGGRQREGRGEVVEEKGERGRGEGEKEARRLRRVGLAVTAGWVGVAGGLGEAATAAR